MNNQSTIQSTRRAPSTMAQGDGTPSDDGMPTTLHYVRRRDMREGRRTYAICGTPMTIDTALTRACASSHDVPVCPLCVMEVEEREKGWPDDPRPIDVLAMANALGTVLESIDMTVPEAADRLDMDPDRLYHAINDGTLTMKELDLLIGLTGGRVSYVLRLADAMARTIKRMRGEAR